MIDKLYLKQINPNQNKNTYNPKYSEGTYKFLNKYKKKDIKVYWKKKNNWDGKETDFSFDKVCTPQVFFIYEENSDYFGASWSQAMQNKYGIKDYTYMISEFDDITDIFLDKYLKIGRCVFDTTHLNFMLGENHNYVGDENRFETIDGIKKCKWCGKVIENDERVVSKIADSSISEEKSCDMVIELTRIIQRLEREGADLTVDDIVAVRKAKIFLGYSCPMSIEEGTGAMVSKSKGDNE